MRTKEHEKIEKHHGLVREVQRMWRVRIQFIPVVVGALGTVLLRLKYNLRAIGMGTSISLIQKSETAQWKLRGREARLRASYIPVSISSLVLGKTHASMTSSPKRSLTLFKGSLAWEKVLDNIAGTSSPVTGRGKRVYW